MEIILSQRMVIILGVAAAVLVVIGSALRIQQKEGRKRIATLSIYAGYLFFALSILFYVLIGFR
jgi:glucose uptake protein GlcU